MAIKHYVDEIPPSTGREYEINTNGTKSTIKDVTNYEQIGSGFGAADVNATCILECNHVKDGNVHYLTTDNVNTENIKFYAKADFVKGDTFKFNGETVVAKTTDGRGLEQHFFVAYTVVECKKRGKVLYFQGKCNLLEDDSTHAGYYVGVLNGVMYIEEV